MRFLFIWCLKFHVMSFSEISCSAKFMPISCSIYLGCSFHLGQSFWRRFSKLGLTDLYRQKKVRETFRCVYALSFLPPNLVPRAFNLIIANSTPGLESDFLLINQCFKFKKIIIEFLSYIGENYVGLTQTQLQSGIDAFKTMIPIQEIDQSHTFDSNLEPEEPEEPEQFFETNEHIYELDDIEIVDPPYFQIELWNLRDRVNHKLPRCNNSMEAFHGVFKVNTTND